MARQRPTAVTVMGILNIVFGSLSLLCLACSGIILLIMANQSGLGNPVLELFEAMRREIPGYVPVTILSLTLGVLMAVLLIVAGIGLLNMRGWGRVLSIVYGIVTILTQIGAMIYQFAYVNPAMQRVHENLPPAFRGGMSGDPTFNAIMSMLGAILGMVYAIVLLIMMLLPGVSAAFGRGGDNSGERYGHDRPEEGDDYERRRRRDWGE